MLILYKLWNETWFLVIVDTPEKKLRMRGLYMYNVWDFVKEPSKLNCVCGKERQNLLLGNDHGIDKYTAVTGRRPRQQASTATIVNKSLPGR